MRTKFLAVALLLSSYLGISQQKLTLSEAVNYALENKAEAVKAQLDIANSEVKIKEVRANALPSINAQGGLTYNPILQKMAMNIGGQTMVIRMGQPWQSQATVQLNQQLFNQAVFIGLKAARTTREFYQINAQLTEEQIIEKVATSYYEVYKTQSQLKTLTQTIDNTNRVKAVIQSLYDNGLAKKIDLDRMIVAVNNLESNKVQLTNAIELQENALKYLIGMDMNIDIELPDTTFEPTRLSFIADDSTVENRTEIKVLEKQRELLQLNKKATEAAGLPTLSLSANYGYLGFGEKMPWWHGSPNANWANFSAIGLNLTVPIFNGGAVKAKVKQAEIDLQKLEVETNDVRLALDLSLKNALTKLNNSMLTINTQRANVNLAKDVLTNVENNYKYGLANLTDLIEAENAHAEAQNNYTNALLDFKLAEIELIKAKGELRELTK